MATPNGLVLKLIVEGTISFPGGKDLGSTLNSRFSSLSAYSGAAYTTFQSRLLHHPPIPQREPDILGT